MGWLKKAKKKFKSAGKKIKKAVSKTAKDLTKLDVRDIATAGMYSPIKNFDQLAINDFKSNANSGLKWANDEILKPIAGAMAPKIDLGEDPMDSVADSADTAGKSVEAEQDRARRYMAYSTDTATGKKRRLGSYGEGTALQQYMDRAKGGLIGGQS